MLKPVRPNAKTVLFAVIALLGLGGCTTYTFKVDAVRNDDASLPGASYEIVSANPERDETDPLVVQASSHVKTALSSKGLFEAPEEVSPTMVVEIDFGMDAPRRQVSITTEAVYRNVRGPGYYETYDVTQPDGTVRTVTRYIPGEIQSVFAGWKERTVVFYTHPKYMRVTARETPDQAGDRPPRELWSVYVSNEDESDDLERYLPLMVSVAMDSMGERTTSAKTVTVSDKDERVVFVKQGML